MAYWEQGGGAARRHWRNGHADRVSRCTKMPMTARPAHALVLVVLAALAACTSPDPVPGIDTGAPATAGPTATALDAYRGYLRVSDASGSRPLAENWSTRFAEYATDPELTSAIEQWQSLRDLGIVFFGDTVIVSATIREQTDTRAIIDSCLDETGVAAQQNGRDLPNDPSQIRRGRTEAELFLVDLNWKVSRLTLFRDQPC